MICYHHNDLDGKAAAYCVHNFKPKTIIDSPSSYYQCTYDDAFDKHTIKDDVIIVDLSFTLANYGNLLEICRTARTVTWIDHHQSSIDVINAHLHELQSVSNLTYFVSNCACGAALTYAYFHIPREDLLKIRRIEKGEVYNISAEYDVRRDIKRASINVTLTKGTEVITHNIELPMFIMHVDDYDCWKKIFDPDTDCFILGCDSQDTSFTHKNRNTKQREFTKFWFNTSDAATVEMIRRGGIVYDYVHSKNYRNLKNNFEWTYQGTTFVCINGTGNSWNFEHLLKKYPAGILFYYDGSAKVWKYSCFADESSTFDCKAFCEQFGGGGHYHAAGFSTKKLIFTSPEYSEKVEKERIIFLGGTCNDDPWREEFIDNWNKLKKTDDFKDLIKDIELFNPVVDDWNEAAAARENEVKNNAFVNLFVITPRMTGVYSIAEAVECCYKPGTKTVFVTYDKFNEGFGNDGRNEKSLDAVGELIERNGGVYLKFGGEKSIIDLVHEVVKKVI